MLEARRLLTPTYPLTSTTPPVTLISTFVGQPISTDQLLTFTVDNPVPPDATAVPPNTPSPVLSDFTWGNPSTGTTTVTPEITAGDPGWVTSEPDNISTQISTGNWFIHGSHTYTQPGTYLVQATVTMTGNPAYDGETITLSASVKVAPIPPPTISLSFSDPAPVKGQTFTLDVTVTNNAPFSMTLPINFAYDIEPLASKGGGTTQPPLTLAPGQTKTVDVYDFNVDWPWIPSTNPLAAFSSSIINNLGGNIDLNGSSIYLTLAGALAKAVPGSTSGAISVIKKEIGILNSAESSVQSPITSQSLNVTTTLPYDPAGDSTTASAATTVKVPDAKLQLLDDFKRLDGISASCMSESIKYMVLAGASAAASTLVIDTPVTLPAAAGSASLAVEYLIGAIITEGLAQVAYTQAVDPPDSDYQVIPTAILGLGDQINSLISQDPQAAPALNALAAYAGDMQAGASATNKSEGAANAGDLSWEAKQLTAAAGFEADAQVQLVQLAAGWPQAPSLPAGLNTILADEGWTQDQITQFDQATAPGSGNSGSAGSDLQAILNDEQDLAAEDLQQAVTLNTKSLNQPVSPLSSTDTQALATDHVAALAAIAQGDPNGAAATAIGAYVSEAVKVALATNNPAAVQADLTSADTLLSSDIQQVIAAHSTGVAEPTPITPTAPVTPTPPSAASTAGPIVSNVAVRTARRRIAAIIITFNVPIAGTPAGSVANYGVHLLNRGRRQKNGVHQTDVGRAVAISAATYDPSGPSVTLTLSKRLRSNQRFQLSVNGGSGGVTDQAGNPLNSPASGAPGNSFVDDLS
jgi:hypothetical protein